MFIVRPDRADMHTLACLATDAAEVEWVLMCAVDCQTRILSVAIRSFNETTGVFRFYVRPKDPIASNQLPMLEYLRVPHSCERSPVESVAARSNANKALTRADSGFFGRCTLTAEEASDRIAIVNG